MVPASCATVRTAASSWTGGLFLRAELRDELSRKQPLAPGLQLKYSNHGYGLLGLMIEEISGTEYPAWITRHVIEAAGLKETVPDMPQLPRSAPLAMGHSGSFPSGSA